MSPADWRALLEAYLDGRLSPEAFARRYIEGVRSAASGPRAIAELFAIVEAFDAAADNADQGATNDDDMRAGARRALRDLRDEPAVQPHTFDRTRAREDIRRFEIRAQRLVGLGCFIALAWVALCILQIYFVSEWIQQAFDWGAWPSAVIGFVLAFVPIVGNLLAFLGATQEGWPTWIAAIVFFAAPAATFLSGWSRWRRTGR